MNSENLQKLADRLTTVGQEQFDMGIFWAYKDEDGDEVSALDLAEIIRGDAPKCPTAACALGHAATIFPLEEKGWLSFGERVFEVNPCSREWDWCFSGTWDKFDNTPTGAAKRIQYLIDHGQAPEGWSFEAMSHDPEEARRWIM